MQLTEDLEAICERVEYLEGQFEMKLLELAAARAEIRELKRSKADCHCRP